MTGSFLLTNISSHNSKKRYHMSSMTRTSYFITWLQYTAVRQTQHFSIILQSSSSSFWWTKSVKCFFCVFSNLNFCYSYKKPWQTTQLWSATWTNECASAVFALRIMRWSKGVFWLLTQLLNIITHKHKHSHACHKFYVCFYTKLTSLLAVNNLNWVTAPGHKSCQCKSGKSSFLRTVWRKDAQ